ncbi:MAG: hypothetical protein ACTHJQ_19380 [Rhizobiaceae bacterium]
MRTREKRPVRMNEASKARPVSGEIMTDASAPAIGVSARPTGDVIDAEFETIMPGIPASPAAERPSTRFTVQAPEIAGMDVLKRTEVPPRRPRGQPGGPAFWTFGLCLTALAFWVSGGHALLPSVHLPVFLASAPTLKIASVHTSIEKIDGHAILFVDGSAANETGRTIEVPPLAISVEDEDGRITRFFLGTRDREVAAGEIFAFSSRLEVPKDGIKSVSVSFDRQD